MDSKYKNPDNDIMDWKTTDANAPGAFTHQGMVYAIQNPFTGDLCYPAKGRCWCREQEFMLSIMQKWANYELREIDDAVQRAEICGTSVGAVRSGVLAIMLSEELSSAQRKAEKLHHEGPWPVFYFTNGGKGGIARKTYLDKVQDRTPTNFWNYNEVGHTDEAKKEIKALFNGIPPFDTPKPVRLIRRMVEIATDKDSIVMDFFSGSATTAQAVVERNAVDSGSRKYILVQLPEHCNTDRFSTLCEIGKERIRRAGDKIKEESPLTTADLDIGFRVFKLDDTNMTDVYYSADEYSQDMLTMLESNIKPDRTDLDLLFGCLLEWGLPLSMPYHSETLEGCKVHTYNDGDLIACFYENVPDSVIKEIAKRKPLRAVFRDSSFASSPAKINIGEIFKMLAPDTRVKVI